MHTNPNPKWKSSQFTNTCSESANFKKSSQIKQAVDSLHIQRVYTFVKKNTFVKRSTKTLVVKWAKDANNF